MQRNRLGHAAMVAFLAACSTHAAWNLPYPRPAVYDYSQYYSQSIKDYLAVVPTFYRDEVAKGWRYYKSTFMNRQTGLIVHQRLDPGGAVIGTNEAVSEGQGYGMLLALINNDKAAFDSIFTAANTYMWDAGTKTYFYWRVWIGGGREQGAATDADLDITLALIFADKLVQKGFWNDYNRSGITYRSRALELIRSIRSRMTQNDYLLPGDNWGADAINNLNPSYFATAWFKVFNAYQSDVDYTAVITKCYDVIARMPRYSSGKAVDWCTPTGGRTSRSYGMGADAIRVPWRLAFDALWFDDSRAKAYCYNTRNTLTQYANANKGFLCAQMGQYDENGVLVNGTATCAEMAMWTCGILGSKNVTYTTEGVHAVVLGQIVGTDADYLGSFELQDHKFYYKQSLALLGLALIGGQFPNVLADMQNLSACDHGRLVRGRDDAGRAKVMVNGVGLPTVLPPGEWTVSAVTPQGRLVWGGRAKECDARFGLPHAGVAVVHAEQAGTAHTVAQRGKAACP